MLRKAVVMLGVLVLVCGVSAAQGKGRGRGKGKGEGQQGGMTAVLQTLGLSDEQKTKVDELLVNYREKTKAATTKEDKKAARQAFEAELEKVLTPEQMTKYREEMKKQHQAAKEKGAGKEKAKGAEGAEQ